MTIKQRLIEELEKRINYNMIDRLPYNQFRQLLSLCEECDDKGFSTSGDLSRYIKSASLEKRYDLIAGKLDMNVNGRDLTFDGGIDPKLYSVLCNVCDLGNSGNFVKIKRFKPYKSIH